MRPGLRGNREVELVTPPLAAASERLKGKPGRPRKPQQLTSECDSERHTTAVAPRLLDLAAAASYLALSAWTIRDLDAAGVLKRVRVPLANGGELRKVLFDRRDLDRLIDAWKDLAP